MIMEEKLIRVAQVLGSVAEGGVEAMVMNYYRNIDKTKVQFDFLVECTSKIINKAEIESMGGKVIIIPSIKNIFKYQRTLKKVFKEGKYDIVHAQKSSLNVFALRAAKKAKIKVRISHAHSTGSNKEGFRNFAKRLLRRFSKCYATHYFACGEKAGRWLFGDKTFDKGEVTIINNAIDLEKFKFNPEMRKEKRDEFGIKDEYVIGHVGRFVKQKNHSFLIDVMNEVVNIRKDVKLLLIGDGPLLEETKKKVNYLGLNEYVIFAGTKSDTYNYYNAMDCFCLTSLYEGLPVVGIESQINGLTIFFSDTVTREVGINDNSKFLPLNSSAKEWARIIVEDYKNSKYSLSFDKRSEYSKKFRKSKYDIESETNKLLKKYSEYICNK